MAHLHVFTTVPFLQRSVTLAAFPNTLSLPSLSCQLLTSAQKPLNLTCRPPASSSPLMSDRIIPPQMFHFSWKVREGAKKDRVSSSFSPLSFSAFRAAKEFSAPPTFDIRQQGPDTRRHRRPRAQGCLSSPKQGH